MRRQNGFSLIEFLILVSLLAVLAGVTVPQYFRLQEESEEAALITDLAAVRDAISLYQKEHDQLPPGVLNGESSENTFVRHLTLRTDARGLVETAAPLGPYLPAGIPANPFNRMRTVKIITEGDSPRADDSTGWIYHVPSVSFFANSTASSTKGTPLSSL